MLVWMRFTKIIWRRKVKAKITKVFQVKRAKKRRRRKAKILVFEGRREKWRTRRLVDEVLIQNLSILMISTEKLMNTKEKTRYLIPCILVTCCRSLF